ncbi:MAG: HNH endonuclease [Thermomicrobiales bacterium]|nr:HNH endonuclease [Thermomicrobiales bacterium]
MFKIDQVYERAKIHDLFGGERQKGISKPASHDFIMLFSGGAEKASGYENGWLDDWRYQYSGEGQSGDMQMTGGNRAIRDHAPNGKVLYLFERTAPKFYAFRGEMTCEGHELVTNVPGGDGQPRTIILFQLRRRI